MYSNEYDDEEEKDEQQSGSFISNFYNNNKVLVWIFIGIIIFLILMSLFTKGGSNTNNNSKTNKYEVAIRPDGTIVVAYGHSTKLIATVEDVSNPVISWSSENEEIAKIDNDGTVSGVGYGKSTIVATYIHTDGNEYKATTEVLVADGSKDVPLTNATFKDGDLLMPVNGTYQISLLLTPSNSYVTSKTFKSSDTNVVTVDNAGKVVAVGEGSATINFSVNDTYTGSLNVYVNNSYTRSEIMIVPNEIRISSELRKIKIGSTEKISVLTTPENADQTKFAWSSSDENIVTVDNNGRIKGIKEGAAKVTVTAVNGKSASIDVEVEKDITEVTDISLSIDSITLIPGQKQTIIPIVSPSDASNKSLTFDSLDPSVATVDPNATGTSAIITAVSGGSTEVVIRSTNNIEKRLSVQVTGSSSGSESSGGSSSSGSSSGSSGGTPSTTIVVRIIDSNNKEIAPNKTCTSTMQIVNPAKVRITVHDGLKYIKWCIGNASSKCTPSNTANSGYEYVNVPSGGLYLLRIQKFDSSGKEIASSNSGNYVDGALEYYINTSNSTSVNCANGSSGGQVSSNFHSVLTAYGTEADARNNSYINSTSVKFSVFNSNGYIKYCIQKGGTCIPSNKVIDTYTRTISDEGLYYIGVDEFDNNGTKVGGTYRYYVNIMNDNGSGNQQSQQSSLSRPLIRCLEPTADGNTMKDLATCQNGKMCGDGYACNSLLTGAYKMNQAGNYTVYCKGDNGEVITASCSMKAGSTQPTVTASPPNNSKIDPLVYISGFSDECDLSYATGDCILNVSARSDTNGKFKISFSNKNAFVQGAAIKKVTEDTPAYFIINVNGNSTATVEFTPDDTTKYNSYKTTYNISK